MKNIEIIVVDGIDPDTLFLCNTIGWSSKMVVDDFNKPILSDPERVIKIKVGND